MWKDYSSGYIKNNRSSSLSVMIAAFISALLLSLLSGLFYNAWKYEIERVEQEEGGWHSRIIGEFTGEDMENVKNFANVKDAVVNEKGDKGGESILDIYFDNMDSVFSDTRRIAVQIGAAPEKIVYNYELLALYLIRDSSDPAPRLLFPMFILITLLASFSLIMIIHNSFAVSMNARIHQFGIFSSIGATPKQIRACLLQEAAALCAVPIIVGSLLGIAGSMGLLQMVNILLGSSIPGRHKAIFGYHPLVLGLTLLVTIITIWISAWLPAKKLSKLTPLEAIKNIEELRLKSRKNSYLLMLLFGVEGELAGNALKAQGKALRTASLSFILAFLAFTIMQCFFAISEISTRETYFERYQGVWDVMVTIKNADVDTFEETDVLQGLDEVKSAVVYQKAEAKRVITEEEMSEEMKSFGGFSHASGKYVTQMDGGWLVNAPVIILDDNSFLAYCEQIKVTPQLDGAVILNQIRDVTNSDFRHPDLMPYVKEENAASVLRQSKNEEAAYGDTSMSYSEKEEMTAVIPVLAYTEKVPVLREKYAALDYYELVHFIPVSLWKEIKGQIGGIEEDSYICVLGKENGSLEELKMLQEEIGRIVSGKYTIECENRIQEYETNSKQIQGMMAVFGGFCVLLAMIGIGNVFSNTLGFVRQRKREFARYMSVGLTPKDLRKMFCIEALVISGRPILISLPLVIIATGYMLKISYVEVRAFMAEMPLIPILLFMLAILGSVTLAYYLAWRNVQKISLEEVLRDDRMM
ncbi:ABC transporter permease [bacterium D16-54]|nr:ABC transporter permease [bacterium D16-54]RKJ13795.1 ABC transporter permease [bacterium D16-56]